MEKEELERRLEHVHQTLEESEKDKANLQLNVTRLQKSADQTTVNISAFSGLRICFLRTCVNNNVDLGFF